MSEALEARVTVLEGLVKSLQEAVAPADIDGQFGDPEIKKDPTPKYWDGASNKGRRMSQCAPDYLDAFAKYREACAFMSEKEGTAEKLKYAGYDRKDAKRARAWAERLRARGGSAAGPAAPHDDIPF